MTLPPRKPLEPTSSMCLQIAGFDHEDCPAGACRCDCHKESPQQPSARGVRSA